MAERRQVAAWAMYDWANSGYTTLLITIVVAYIQRVVFSEAEHGDAGAVVYAWGISLSMLLAAVLSPLVGAIADARASKRQWLAATALGGAILSIILGLLPANRTWSIAVAFFATNLCLELSLVFYNGFLPEIAEADEVDRVSAWGYALGYIGGGIALILAMLLVRFGESLGLPDGASQLRAGIVLMGCWWGLFTLPAVWVLRDKGPPRSRTAGLGKIAHQAASDVARTLKNIRAYRTLALFLLAFLFYNDGVQTVLSQSSTFALRELDFSEGQLAGLVLMIQFVAFPGALLVGKLASRFGRRGVLLACLAGWIAILVTAYFVHRQTTFWVLGACVALLMGGTQSVSRSATAALTPLRHSAEFFGFFNLSGKATSFLGPFLFGWIIHQAGSARLAIVSLLIFFIVGTLIIARLDLRKGEREKQEADG